MGLQILFAKQQNASKFTQQCFTEISVEGQKSDGKRSSTPQLHKAPIFAYPTLVAVTGGPARRAVDSASSVLHLLSNAFGDAATQQATHEDAQDDAEKYRQQVRPSVRFVHLLQQLIHAVRWRHLQTDRQTYGLSNRIVWVTKYD